MTEQNKNRLRNADLTRAGIRAGLDADAANACSDITLFAEIDSTNTWLLQHPAPPPGAMHVAVADFQSAGRGRRGRKWNLPASAGVCFSLAWTFADSPRYISSLALAIGVAAKAALRDVGTASIELKWPNDLIADHGKLGGILVEASGPLRGGSTIVAGIGINRVLPPGFGESIRADATLPPTDLAHIFTDRTVPSREQIVAALINQCVKTLREFSASGFDGFRGAWQEADYLKGKLVEIVRGTDRIEGRAVGIGENGELLVDTSGDGTTIERIDSGSVTLIVEN